MSKYYTLDDESATWDDDYLWIEGTFNGRDAYFRYETASTDSPPITDVEPREIDGSQVIPETVTASLRLDLVKIELLEEKDD